MKDPLVKELIGFVGVIITVAMIIVMMVYWKTPREKAEDKAPLICAPFQVKTVYNDRDKYMVVCAAENGVQVKEIK